MIVEVNAKGAISVVYNTPGPDIFQIDGVKVDPASLVHCANPDPERLFWAKRDGETITVTWTHQGTGLSLIAEERGRQIAKEGWTIDHDDEHDMGELIGASVSYAGAALHKVSDGEIDAMESLKEFWPFDEACWKPSDDPIRNLVKAGALIAAEIDRLQRLKEKDAPTLKVKP
jgi:hypothetical protein